MAKVKNPLFSEKVSGRFIEMIFQAWRGLNVVRNFTMPTNPQSPRQMTVRAIFTAISQYWANTLPEGLRVAWSRFVFRWADLWGDEVSLTGLNLFEKFNFVLRDSGRNYQITTPPPIKPSELGADTYLVNPGGADVATLMIGLITLAEKIAQDCFVDILFAGGGVITALGPSSWRLETVGMPQGVNPVKSDYRHLIYITDRDTAEPNQIYLQTPAGQPCKISFIVRRYNKYGNYSEKMKYSDIVLFIP